MADRKIDASGDNPAQFRIPVNPGQQVDFPQQKPIVIEMSADNARQFDVFQKDIPLAARGARLEGRPVRWLNNFGLKRTGSAQFEINVPPYTILIDRIQNAAYVYFDGSQPVPLPVSDVEGDSSQVKATLNLGDPAIGWV